MEKSFATIATPIEANYWLGLGGKMASEEVVHADPNEVGMYEIESLCMNCEDNVRQKKTSSLAE